MNVGELADMVEIYCGEAGLSNSSIDRDLILRLLNNKAAELLVEAAYVGDDLTIQSQANVMEYDIPNSGVDVTPEFIQKVFVDTVRAGKISYDNLEALQDAND